MIMVRQACATVVLAVVAGWCAPAQSSPASDRNLSGRIGRAFDKLAKDPALFNGSAIPDTANPRALQVYAARLRAAINTFEASWPGMSPAAQQQDGAIKARYEELKPYTEALEAALPGWQSARDKERADAVEQKRAAEQAVRDERERKIAASRAEQERERSLCTGFWAKVGDHSAQRAIVAAVRFNAAPESLRAARAAFDKLTAMCQSPEHAGVKELCGKQQYRVDGVTPADLCADALASTELLQKVVLDAIPELNVGKAPTLEELRAREGWIPTTEKFDFNAHLRLDDADRPRLLAKVKPLFEAAGVPVPETIPTFAAAKAYYDAYRASVEALAPTLTTPGKACKGYWCAMAKKSLLEWHPKAKILKNNMDDTIHAKSTGGRVTEAYLNGFLLYRLPGETWCQLRAWTVTESAGQGKAKGIPLYYVRIQQCK